MRQQLFQLATNHLCHVFLWASRSSGVCLTSGLRTKSSRGPEIGPDTFDPTRVVIQEERGTPGRDSSPDPRSTTRPSSPPHGRPRYNLHQVTPLHRRIPGVEFAIGGWPHAESAMVLGGQDGVVEAGILRLPQPGFRVISGRVEFVCQPPVFIQVITGLPLRL